MSNLLKAKAMTSKNRVSRRSCVLEKKQNHTVVKVENTRESIGEHKHKQKLFKLRNQVVSKDVRKKLYWDQ